MFSLDFRVRTPAALLLYIKGTEILFFRTVGRKEISQESFLFILWLPGRDRCHILIFLRAEDYFIPFSDAFSAILSMHWICDLKLDAGTLEFLQVCNLLGQETERSKQSSTSPLFSPASLNQAEAK